MNEPTTIHKLIKANLTLVETTSSLAETNRRAVKINETSIDIIQGQIKKDEEIIIYLKDEYQALSDKKKRSVQEECQYQFIQKLLVER
jgi:acetone carboxylase gamma subunit